MTSTEEASSTPPMNNHAPVLTKISSILNPNTIILSPFVLYTNKIIHKVLLSLSSFACIILRDFSMLLQTAIIFQIYCCTVSYSMIIQLYSLLVMYICIVLRFWLLCIILFWTFLNVLLGAHLHLFLFSLYIREKLLAHGVQVFPTLVDNIKWFSKSCIIYVSSNSVWTCMWLHSLTNCYCFPAFSVFVFVSFLFIVHFGNLVLSVIE